MRCSNDDAPPLLGQERISPRGLLPSAESLSVRTRDVRRNARLICAAQVSPLGHFRSALPQPVKRRLRFSADFALDLIDLALGRREELVPPRRLLRDFDGTPEHYKATGEEFFHHFVGLCRLQPHETVLEVGSGIGRMAVPLTRYLSESGRYHGFDIMVAASRWCDKVISRRYRNFHFRHVDVFNDQYNPKGEVRSELLAFPYPDKVMDFVFLTSVFTHMMPPEVDHYLSEIRRVLNEDGGRCLITCFLVNEESCRGISDGRSALRFGIDRGDHLLEFEDRPAAAVAFREATFLELLRRHQFRALPPIHFGSWSGRRDGLSFQDIVLVEPS